MRVLICGYKMCECACETWMFDCFNGFTWRREKGHLLPISLPAVLVFTFTVFCGAKSLLSKRRSEAVVMCSQFVQCEEGMLVFSTHPQQHLHYNIQLYVSALAALCLSGDELLSGNTASCLKFHPWSLFISLPPLCPLSSSSSSSAPLQSFGSTAVWNPEWHFKVLSVSWDQACVSIRNPRDWP